jgi:intein/homing endonuclease
MDKNTLKPIELHIENEQKYLSYLFNIDASDCLTIDDKVFLNKTLKTIFCSIKKVYQDGNKVELDIILDVCKQSNQNITYEQLKTIKEFFSDFENIEIVKNRLKQDYLKQVSIKQKIEKLLIRANESTDINIEEVKKLNEQLNDSLLELESDEKNLLFFSDMVPMYQEILKNRDEGKKYTLGVHWLDKYITYPGEPGDMMSFAMRKGEGKCINKDSLLLTENGFQYIDSFSKNKEGFNFDINNKCLIGNRDLIKPEAFYEETVKKTIKIKTRFGFEIEGTPEHPILIINDVCKYEYKKLEDISENDYVIIFNNTQIYSKKNKNFDFIFEKKKSTSNIKKVNLPEKITKNLARFLGYYIGNGIISKNCVAISTKNVKIQKDVLHILKDFNLKIGKISDEKDLRISSVVFKEFIKYLIGNQLKEKTTARYKNVPEFILQGTKEIQIEFLKGLFDCDSWANNEKLEYYTASKQLCKEVQLMLLNMGIFSFQDSKYLEKYDHEYFELTITSEDFDNYKKLVNFNSLKYNFKISNIKRNTNIKTIPFIKSYIKEELKILRNSLGVTQKSFIIIDGKLQKYGIRHLEKLNNTIAKNLTFSNLEKMLNVIEEQKYYHQYKEIQNIKNMLESIKNSDFLYDKIEKINIIKEEKKVYDFTISNEHNFYSNGIISHNTVFGLNLANVQINQKIPVIYFCFDMGWITIMDRWLCLREGFLQGELLQEDKTRDQVRKITRSLDSLKTIDNFIFYPAASMSLTELNSYLYKAKNEFRKRGVLGPNDNYCILYFDTLDMIDEFSGVDAYGIKYGVNKLHSILRQHQCFAVNLLQLNENIIRAKKPKELEDVKKIRFTKEDIEGGASYASRSRVVIIGTRPKAMMKSFFPEEKELIDLEEDIMYLSIDKQNDGDTGRIPPLIFDTTTYRLDAKKGN